jgi:hypothetical protein
MDRQRHRLLLCAIVIAGLAPMPVLAAESVYTDFPFENPACKSLAPDTGDEEAEGMGVSLVCPGYKDYPVYYKDGDGRISIHYGFLSDAVIKDAWESFGAFNSVAEKIEWRLDAKGVPVAAIHRYRLANFNPDTGMADESMKGEVLVVSRVGRKDDRSGCFVGLVDARENKDANAIARRIADTEAAGFRCGTDTPRYHGKQGPYAGDPTISFGPADATAE